MRGGVLGGYRCFGAGTYPAENERGAKMYRDFDHGLAGERAARMREGVEHYRLEARLARAARSGGDGAALVAALFASTTRTKA